VLTYVEVLRGAPVGRTVAVIGAGGIGFDVSEFLLHPPGAPLPMPRDAWLDEWGVDLSVRNARRSEAPLNRTRREIWLLQRKAGKLGAGLGKTSGWVHRATLARNGVHMLDDVSYLTRSANARTEDLARAAKQWLEVETIVVCAGQESLRELYPATQAAEGTRYHLIGGAALATELDAKRAIREGAELAARL
jgi:2,4-dienoyl-CoA reductase (NADPH2)